MYYVIMHRCINNSTTTRVWWAYMVVIMQCIMHWLKSRLESKPHTTRRETVSHESLSCMGIGYHQPHGGVVSHV